MTSQKKIITTTVFLLSLSLAAWLLSGCGPARPKTPEEAFKRWLKYQEKKDYEKAWAGMTTDLQNRRGIRGFHVGLLTAGWQGEFEEFVEDKGLYDYGDESGDAEDLISRVKTWDIEIKDNKAKLTKIVPYRGFDWHLEAVLILQSDEWKIAEFSAIGHLPPGSTMKWIE